MTLDVINNTANNTTPGENKLAGFNLALRGLTTSALLLPGLFQPTVYATEEDSVDFQYSHYQERKRSVYGRPADVVTQTLGNPIKLPNALNPIEVDGLHGSARISLSDRVKFAFNYTQDTWSGATPAGTAPGLINASRPKMSRPNDPVNPGVIIGASPYASDGFEPIFMDKQGRIYSARRDDFGQLTPGIKSNQLTHVLSYASPETRKQGDFKLIYNWDEAALDVGGGVSTENDYESRFVNLGGRMDFNQKQTSVNLNLSYTNSDISATLDPDSLQFIDTSLYDTSGFDPYLNKVVFQENRVDAGEVISDWKSFHTGVGEDDLVVTRSAVLRGNRQDWSTQLGVNQALNPNAELQLNFGYTRSTGYLANPYKLVYGLVANISPDQAPDKPLLFLPSKAQLEMRPDERNLFNWNIGYNQYIRPLDAALHFNYRFAHDDWGINAHTFEADWVQPLGAGWTLTPRVRYYSQSEADFYMPFITSVQVIDPVTGLAIDSPLNRPIPKLYSSDQRLSGFGAISGGVTINKQFAKGVNLEAGFEYYTHQGNLKIGGGGEQAFADYDFWSANAALKFNLEALASPAGHRYHAGHTAHHHHSNAPANVMFDHTLGKVGDLMIGYRFMRSEQAGGMLSGTIPISLENTRINGCGSKVCLVSPDSMVMNMHMLDLMYAPADWLTLMLMPQWMDMEMTMTQTGEVKPEAGRHNHGGAIHNHQTGGIGDTGLYALFKLFEHPRHHVILGLGGTAPTGDVDITLRQTHTTGIPGIPIHYGMQLGSGTWDFKPSLTYTGELDNFNWGAQATGTIRIENLNESGFAFGDIFQGSIWGGYQWTNWLSMTVRWVYTTQGRIHGAYPPILVEGVDPDTGLPGLVPYVAEHVGPFDQPDNYGGRFVDLGLGINVNIPYGAFAGNSFKFEWLQPIHTDYNGYQLDRDHSLAFTWNYGF